MAQQTAVMELLNFILAERRSNEDGSIKFHAHEDFERFLEMEKEQIINAHTNGQAEFDTEAFRQKVVDNAEQYYNETYNK